ncbi:MAG TPA: SRPBCC domain-containing protein [Patescibacteria group bacterium]|jgi:activator of HSP90 ATPase|nr:SRPBCC domain-containing protein [Patescibacteria group bacterium]
MKTIKQSVIFRATPEDLYEWIINPKKHAEFTGAAATNSGKVGGKFTAWNGFIDGINKKLVPGKEIVQSWHAADWKIGVYSMVSFKFKKDKAGTKLEFIQTGVPNEHYEDIKQGWYDNYWDLLKKELA